MAKLKKRTPAKVPADMERAVQQIYDDINDIINSVNSYQLEEIGTQGKLGDIRIIQEQSGSSSSYYIEFRTRDGWARSEGTLINE
tara:strand:+ start:1039 stop:1293 length:255 start_codon:yes stop_codon:yes gene_type:complete